MPADKISPEMQTVNADESKPLILTVNGGSSSIKFAVFRSSSPPIRWLSGQIERIGTINASLTTTRDQSSQPDHRPIVAATFREGVQGILSCLRQELGGTQLAGIGHRVVHGGVHLLDSQLVTPELIAELRRSEPLDLAHLPREIALIEGFRQAFPEIPQIACFDTSFHRDLPRVAQLLPIPRRYFNAGVRRYGFHGLSYTYLMSQLAEIAGPAVADGRVILAHLGSGASLAAVRGRKPIDTTMAFTPTSGLVMGTRPGDLDPGLLVYLMKDQKLSLEAMDKFISEQCGLLGVSEVSSDMRDLLAIRDTDPRAADAVALFCQQVKKHLCAMAGTLNGLDTLIFAGGIGEHCAPVRAEICEGLEFLGLNLDTRLNTRGHGVISAEQSHVRVEIIPTDEELIIAKIVRSIVQR